jgi:diaminopimelate epimerase
MKIPFIKMHGIGNDFVLIDNRKKAFSITPAISKKMADRKFGIGADQILVIEPSESADCRMLIYNADGSQVEMCGNGIRCLAAYYKKNIACKEKILVETLAGEREILFRGDLIEVDMGVPILSPAKIPVEMEGPEVIKREIEVNNEKFLITAVSMGNPHCILFVDDAQAFPLESYGPLFEGHQAFPHRTNFECVQVIDRETIRTRVWERGVGITLACGTGACASYVAACLSGKTERDGLVVLDGGELKIKWREDDNHVAMLGPAEEVFEGVFYW